jgi:CrcB protein
MVAEKNKGKTNLRRYLLIAIGGALGAILRYVVGVFAAERLGTRFPAGTFAINISACFMIGFILEYLTRHTNMNPAWRYGFAIGFLGAYSTFSSFEWETWTQLTRGAYWMALLYVGASLMIGLLAVGLGSAAARSFR